MDTLSFQEEQIKQKRPRKSILWAVLAVTITFVGAITIGKDLIEDFSHKIHPLLSEQQQMYAYFKGDMLNTTDFRIIEEATRSLFSQEEKEELSFLETVMQEFSINTGFFTVNTSEYYFIDDQNCRYTKEISEKLAVYNWKISQLQIEESCFTVFSEENWRQYFAESSQSTLKTKLLLLKNEKNGPTSALFVRNIVKGRSFIGVAYSFPQTVQILFGRANARFTEPMETKRLSNADFTFIKKSEEIENDHSFTPIFQSLSSFSHIPGEFNIYGGDLESFTRNKYASDQSWFWKGSVIASKELEKLIINDLADNYPIAVEQMLPDETVILELQESREAFLSSQMDEDGNEVQFYTYPDGQIVQKELEDFVSIEKNVDQDLSELDHNCIYPQSLGFGQVSGEFLNTNLWKTAQFSYDQQKMVLCYRKNT